MIKHAIIRCYGSERCFLILDFVLVQISSSNEAQGLMSHNKVSAGQSEQVSVSILESV